MAEEEKGPKDHPHQRGIWFAHDTVNGIDFWDNEAGYTEPPKRGKMVWRRWATKSSKDRGSLAATFDWTDRQGNKVLTEKRLMTFHAGPKLRIVDLDITLTSVQTVTGATPRTAHLASGCAPS